MGSIVNSIFRCYYFFSTLWMNLFSSKRLMLGKKVSFQGFPCFIIHKKSLIKIGDNTLINSSNRGYFANMHSGCKLFIDRKDAIISIGNNCRIHGTCIHAFSSITIGNNCLIAANTQIVDANGHALSFDDTSNRINAIDESAKPIIIGNNVWIGMNSIILGGTIIGDGSIIAANSVVKANIPPNCIYGGNPSKLIKQY